MQAYRKHEAKGIFRVQELPWGEMAEGWGLLKLPRMPELKLASGVNKRKRDGGGAEADSTTQTTEAAVLSPFEPPDVNWSTYAHAHPEKEAKRVAELQNPQAPANTAPKKKVAFSHTQDAHAEAQERREAGRQKKERRRLARMSEGERERAREVEGLIERVRVEKEKELEGEGFEGFEGFD